MVKFIPTKKKASISDNPSVQGAKSGFSKVRSKLKWLDPFTYVDLFVMPRVKKITESGSVELIVNVLFAFLFAAILYFILGFLFGTGSPLVIVYSASMEPNLYRGDVMGLLRANASMDFGPEVILNQSIKGVGVDSFVSPNYSLAGSLVSLTFSNGQVAPYSKTGSIIVYPAYNPLDYAVATHGKPIIHRTIAKIRASDGVFVLTKGDNDSTNPRFDEDCGKVILDRPDEHCITLYAIPIEQIQGVAFFNIPKVGCVKLWLLDDLLSLVATGKLPSDFKGVC